MFESEPEALYPSLGISPLEQERQVPGIGFRRVFWCFQDTGAYAVLQTTDEILEPFRSNVAFPEMLVAVFAASPGDKRIVTMQHGE